MIKILNEYIKAINKIDDYLEYRYKNHSKQEIRNEILKYMDELTRKLDDL